MGAETTKLIVAVRDCLVDAGIRKVFLRIKRNAFIHCRVKSGNTYSITVDAGRLRVIHFGGEYKDKRTTVYLDLDDPECFKKAIEIMK